MTDLKLESVAAEPPLDPLLQECIALRNFQPEDVPLILSILTYSKNDLIRYFHNMFTPSWGTPASVRKELEHIRNGMSADDRARGLFDIMITLLGKYDLYAMYHLEGVLERIHP